MTVQNQIFIGSAGEEKQFLALKLANRHGLITGATGTGKTVTLQILSEGFSQMGVPVFCADVKGDLSGLAKEGEAKDFLEERAQKIGFEDYAYRKFPVIFWDLFGEQGHPIRTTMTEMGPLLLSRLLDLNNTQEGVLNIAFKIAEDESLPLLDLKDLRQLLIDIGQRAKEISMSYGNVSSASVGAIQRRLLVLEQQGAENFFGEPALKISDFMRTTYDGQGFINILAADKLMMTPQLYASFLLWLLTELFEELPEVGDPDKPKMVFFFDEAHLLFDEAPKILMDRIEQVVKLIRSKGVGIYFVTQNPMDIPDSVLSQLGNRVQHALRAYTPKEKKAVKVAAETFRPNPNFDTVEVITQLGIGEALVSTLQGKAVPSMVQQTLIRPPSSQMGPITPQERQQVMQASPIGTSYNESLDRKSAYEVLKEKADHKAKLRAELEAQEAAEKAERKVSRRGSNRQSVGEAAIKSVTRAIGSSVGRAIVRGVVNSIFRR